MKKISSIAIIFLAVFSVFLITSCETKTPPLGYISCKRCGGDGWIWPNMSFIVWFWPAECRVCGGRGYIRDDNYYQKNFNVSFKGQLWYGEGRPYNPNCDGFIKKNYYVDLGGYRYHVYVKGSSRWIYDKRRGWCRL